MYKVGPSPRIRLTSIKLKPPCVNLSAVALKFRTQDASAKDVLRALESVRDTLSDLSKSNRLDPGLADYVFVPLAQQVFNETKRLSPRCLEVAAECVTILVSNGYRQALMPKLGKELLVLMSLLAGAGNITENQAPPDELRIAAFECISELIKALTSSTAGSEVFEDQGTKNVVDQLAYLLLEAISDGQSEQLQLSASEVLLQIIRSIRSRVFLASLLPRTISSLTKALKPSTTARRTKKVLTAHLRAFRVILDRTLSDRVAISPSGDGEKEALTESWLKATAAQVKNALIQVCKLRNSESPDVHRALEELCVMVIEECHETLTDSISIVLETLIVLSAKPDGASARSTCKHLMIAYPQNADLLRSSLVNWSRSLPRLMQGQDEQPKILALQKLTASVRALTDADEANFTVVEDIIPALVSGIRHALQDAKPTAAAIRDESSISTNMLMMARGSKQDFDRFILDHESQKSTTAQLQELITVLKEHAELPHMIRHLSDSVVDADGPSKLASFWLALQLLRTDGTSPLSMDDFLVMDSVDDRSLTQSSLLADLHAATLPLLGSVTDDQADGNQNWQMQALAIECTIMYAQTFPDDAYRPELVESLYPVLSFLGSSNPILRSHAMTALDKLTLACQYSSTTEMIIENVDYLVNSVAWKLNTYNLSPEAPQILRMMVHLCGAELIPYLDDLIQSVFAALDSYHGYPEWVETLFETLKAMVDVSVEKPLLAITRGKEMPDHKKASELCSSPSDILDDLEARKRRKTDFDRPAEKPPGKAPHRPWTDKLDGPSFPKPVEADEEAGLDEESDEHLSPMKPSEDEEKKLSKPHNLLLSIASSTVPHLASPSPRVRHLLLDLLKDVSPLLGRDENSFLPLINTIWPVIVPRLFAEQADDESGNIEEETAYNICAAADTIAVLCINAGDFMSSRIDDIFQQLVRLFKKIKGQVNTTSLDSDGAQNGTQNGQPTKVPNGQSIRGPVSLQVVKQDASDGKTLSSAELNSVTRPLQQTTRTSKGQILGSLTELLTTILTHVKLTLDAGDEVMQLLRPMMAYRGSIRSALEIYNADSVWLWDQRTASSTQETAYDEPVLRGTLLSAGLLLADVGA